MGRFIFILYLLFSIIRLGAEDFEKKADDAFKAGKFSLAEIYYKKVLEVSPDNFKANYNLGKIYFYNSKYDDAIKYLTTAYDLKPLNEIKFLIANSYIVNNQLEKGLSLYSNILKSEPNYADVHLNAGLVNLKYLYNKERTIYHWEEFLKLRPNDPQAPAIRKALEYLKDPNFVLKPPEEKAKPVSGRGEQFSETSSEESQKVLPVIIKGKDIKIESEEKYKLKDKKQITTE